VVIEVRKTATRNGNRKREAGSWKREAGSEKQGAGREEREERSGKRGSAKSKKRGGRIFCSEVRGENTGWTTISVRRGAFTGTADLCLWAPMYNAARSTALILAS